MKYKLPFIKSAKCMNEFCHAKVKSNSKYMYCSYLWARSYFKRPGGADWNHYVWAENDD